LGIRQPERSRTTPQASALAVRRFTSCTFEKPAERFIRLILEEMALGAILL
jgi:hypothetical protein